MDQLFNGDCLEVMQQLPEACVDMVLCDLPYGLTQNRWDILIPFEPLWLQYKRIAKENAAFVFTATQPFASQLIASNPKMFRYDLIWVKNKVSGFLNAKKMPLRKHEHILVFYNKCPVYNPQKTTGHKPVNSFTKHTTDGTNYGKTKQGIRGGGQTDRHPTSILHFPVVNNDSVQKYHPTQKPIELFEYLILTYTNPGMVVLDNCVGSGTTAIAALRTKRMYIGIEKDEKYYNIASERIKNEI